MSKKFKVGINEDLISIFTYINTSEKKVLMKDLIQYCIDYQLYNELFMNYPIIYRLIDEHNLNVGINEFNKVKSDILK